MRRPLAILLAAAPFVAGSIAALSVRHDLRMLWMALAATVAAWTVVTAMRAPRGSTTVVTAFATASLAAAAVAALFGARAVAGVAAVAIVLAGCATGGAVLARRAPSAR